MKSMSIHVHHYAIPLCRSRIRAAGLAQAGVQSQINADPAFAVEVPAFLVIITSYWLIHYLFASQESLAALHVGNKDMFLSSAVHSVPVFHKIQADSFTKLHLLWPNYHSRSHTSLPCSSHFWSCWSQPELTSLSLSLSLSSCYFGLNINAFNAQLAQHYHMRAHTHTHCTTHCTTAAKVETGTPGVPAVFALAFVSNLFATLTPYAGHSESLGITRNHSDIQIIQTFGVHSVHFVHIIFGQCLSLFGASFGYSGPLWTPGKLQSFFVLLSFYRVQLILVKCTSLFFHSNIILMLLGLR